MPGKSAYPQHTSYGTEDLSLTSIPPSIKGGAQFRPLMQLNTAKGDYRDHIVTGGELLTLFGSKTLDASSAFFNFQSMMALQVLSSGGATATVRRMRPNDINGNPAAVSKVTHFLLTSQPIAGFEYDRDAITGKVIYVSGVPQYTAVAVNYVDAFIVTSSIENITNVGTVTLDGMVYDVTPLVETEAEGHGTFYNNIGISMSPLVGDKENTDMTSDGLMGFRIKSYDKSTGTVKVIKTATGGSTVDFSFDEYATDVNTNEGIAISDLFPSVYGNYTNPARPLQPYTFNTTLKLNSSLYANLATKITDAEYLHQSTKYGVDLAPWNDSVVVEDDAIATKENMVKMLNFLTYVTTSEIEYETVRPAVLSVQAYADLKTANFTVSIPNDAIPSYLGAGSDGLLTTVEFERTLVADMDNYSDVNSLYINTATNKDTFLLDGGLTLDTKKTLLKYIEVRRDTNIVLSTYSWNKDNVVQDWATATSVTSLLNTLAGLYPESVEYNTPSSRVVILIGSGKLSAGGYRYDMPLTVDYSRKMAAFAGGQNGKWNVTKAFSRQPNNLTEAIYDIYPKGRPANGEQLWAAGAMWTEPEDTVQNYYPGQQTVNPNDTSVLNSNIVTLAIGTVARYNDDAYRAFGGATDLTNNELITKVTAFMAAKLKDSFAGIVIPEVNVIITDFDKLTGFSWHLEVGLRAPTMKTVMYSKIIALRKDA